MVILRLDLAAGDVAEGRTAFAHVFVRQAVELVGEVEGRVEGDRPPVVHPR